MKQRIFIGSSKEGLNVAKRVKDFFMESYDCYIWTDGIFQFNKGILETLLKSASMFDFGFMIFSADDLSNIRGKEYDTARDNVLFEYGLFLGRLGIDNAYILLEKGVKIPSDFLGISLAEYNVCDTDGQKEPDASLEETLGKLKIQIDDKANLGHLGLLPSTVMAISYFENFVTLVVDYIIAHEGNLEFLNKKFNSAKLQIVIPNKLDSDIKKYATHYYRTKNYNDFEIPCRHRSYPVHVSLTETDNDEIIFTDMPTTLNGINKAIQMYFGESNIGKTSERIFTEEREINNFTRVLKILINNDADCRDIVEVVIENQDSEK